MPKIVDHQARRAEISAIAAKLIARHGFEGATIREIAANSAYSKGVIEHYFENKEEIISAALGWANTRYQQRIERSAKGLNGLAALRKHLEATLPLTPAVRNEWKVRLAFWSIAAINSDLREEQEKRFAKTVALFEQDLIAAIAAGEIDSDIDTNERARHLSNMAAGICTAALHNRSVYTKAVLNREIDYLVERLAKGDA